VVSKAARAVGKHPSWGYAAIKRRWIRQEIENIVGIAFSKAMKRDSGRRRDSAMDYVRAAAAGDQTLTRQRAEVLDMRGEAIADASEVMRTVTSHLRASMGPFLKRGVDREIQLDVMGAVEGDPSVATWIKSIQTETTYEELADENDEDDKTRRLLRQKVRLEIVDRQRAAADMARILGLLDEQKPQGSQSHLWQRVLEQLPPDTVKQIHLALLRASAPAIDVKAQTA
jgi:hypothetical protein